MVIVVKEIIKISLTADISFKVSKKPNTFGLNQAFETKKKTKATCFPYSYGTGNLIFPDYVLDYNNICNHKLSILK